MGALTDSKLSLRDLLTPGWRERELQALAELAARRAGEPVPVRAAAEPARAVAPAAAEPVALPLASSGSGWFAAPSLPWVHDSENFFTAPAGTVPGAERAVPAVTARPVQAAEAVTAAPVAGAGPEPEPEPAPMAEAAGPWTMADELRYQVAARRAGLDPQDFEQAVNLRASRARQQEALAAVPDPYNRANLAFGKSVQLPYQGGAYGTTNRATGETTPSAFAAAQEALAKQRAEAAKAPYVFGTWGSGNRFTGEQQVSDREIAATDAQLAAAERSRAGVGTAAALAEKARRVQLEDGTIVMAEPGPDGRLRAVPVVDGAGAPVRGRMPATPTAAREYARGDSPQQFLAKQYAFYRKPVSAGGGGLTEEKAAAQARADVKRVFPADAGVWGDPAAVDAARGAASGAAAAPAAGPSRVDAQVAELQAQAAQAMRLRPDQAARIKAQLDEMVAALRAGGG